MEDRKQRILQAVTDDYIQTAEPVGSRTIARKYLPGISPATIRNEMADLEELGYLQQPHASAGRIPSDLGYRYYVEELMEPQDPSRQFVEAVRDTLVNLRDPDRLVHRAGRALARATRYAVLVLRPSLQRLTVQSVQLVAVDSVHALLVVVADPGFVHSRMLEWPDETPNAAVLHELSVSLSELLRGVTARNMDAPTREAISDILRWPSVSEQAREVLNEVFLQESVAEHAYVDGVPFFLEQPEFRNVEQAREVLDYLQEGETLLTVMMGGDLGGLTIVIGGEQPVEALRRCSVVIAPYGSRERALGVMGLIGPTRMDYRRAVAAVQEMTLAVTEALERLAGTASSSSFD